MFSGDLLRKVRKSKKISQEELAAAVGRRAATISLYEGGKIKNPNPEIIDSMAAALGCDSEDIGGRPASSERVEHRARFNRVIELLDSLPEEEQYDVMADLVRRAKAHEAAGPE